MLGPRYLFTTEIRGETMKIRLPYVIQDQLTAQRKGMPVVEGFDCVSDEVFLDGPMTPRVAVLDFDETSGQLRVGAVFEAPKPGRVLGKYQCDKNDVESPQFNQVSVFATVLKTMSMFERDDVLGRALTWAFAGPQLLVVPRAGEWANAFYERSSRSLQFFYFNAPDTHNKQIYSSLSHDIIAHETGHAILDGIAPDLYHALTPQSLALHEAIADLTALIMGIESHNLRKTVLEQTGGTIDEHTAISGVAEEFGRALGNPHYLRSLRNDKSLCSSAPAAQHVRRAIPHDLCQVLTGALFSVLVQSHEDEKQQLVQREKEQGREVTAYSVSGKALINASRRFRRMIFRALDYLPPGEVSFADYARAIVSADTISYPDRDNERRWVTQEFLERCMVSRESELEVETNFHHPAIEDLDLDEFLESDWLAYDFANRYRDLLGIPRTIPFTLYPRRDLHKLIYRRNSQQEQRELVFKVSWEEIEKSGLDSRFPRQRVITVGTTLVIDWGTKQVSVRLTTDRSASQCSDRTDMLQMLVDRELLGMRPAYARMFGRELGTIIVPEIGLRGMRIRGTGRMLFIDGLGATS